MKNSQLQSMQREKSCKYGELSLPRTTQPLLPACHLLLLLLEKKVGKVNGGKSFQFVWGELFGFRN